VPYGNAVQHIFMQMLSEMHGTLSRAAWTDVTALTRKGYNTSSIASLSAAFHSGAAEGWNAAL